MWRTDWEWSRAALQSETFSAPAVETMQKVEAMQKFDTTLSCLVKMVTSQTLISEPKRRSFRIWWLKNFRL
jgi:hypothetical protein